MVRVCCEVWKSEIPTFSHPSWKKCISLCFFHFAFLFLSWPLLFSPSLLCIFSFHLRLLSPFDTLLELVRDGCAGLKSIPEVASNLQKTCWFLDSLGVKCSMKRTKYPGWNGRRML